MAKRVLLFFFLLLILSSCSRSPERTSDSTSIISERYVDTSDVQIIQSQVLPPYGVRVTAEVVVLQMRISSSKIETADRNKDIRDAIDVISALVAEDERYTLAGVSVTQLSGGYARAESASANVQNVDASSVSIKLATNLSQHDHSFLNAIAEYNEFLKGIKLPESITVNELSVEAELGDLEDYRTQIIERVYQELESVKEGYDPSVKFEITGLYDPIKKMQLTNLEYYLYLEPVVKVIEF